MKTRILPLALISAAVLLSGPAHAKIPAWLSAACEALLGGRKAPPVPQNLDIIDAKLFREIHRANNFSAQRFEKERVRLKYIKGEPWSIELQPKLDYEHVWKQNVDASVIINPNFIDADWADENHTLTGPEILLVFDDVKVKLSDGRLMSFAQLVREEAAAIARKNPDLKADIKQVRAGDFPGLAFNRAAAGKTVMWVEGDMANFQRERIAVISLQYAFEQLARDPEFTGPRPKAKP